MINENPNQIEIIFLTEIKIKAKKTCSTIIRNKKQIEIKQIPQLNKDKKLKEMTGNFGKMRQQSIAGK